MLHEPLGELSDNPARQAAGRHGLARAGAVCYNAASGCLQVESQTMPLDEVEGASGSSPDAPSPSPSERPRILAIASITVLTSSAMAARYATHAVAKPPDKRAKCQHGQCNHRSRESLSSWNSSNAITSMPSSLVYARNGSFITAIFLNDPGTFKRSLCLFAPC